MKSQNNRTKQKVNHFQTQINHLDIVQIQLPRMKKGSVNKGLITKISKKRDKIFTGMSFRLHKQSRNAKKEERKNYQK